MCWNLILINLQASVCSFVKKRIQHSCFPVNFQKILGAAFSQNTSGGMPMGWKPEKPAKSTKISECIIHFTDSFTDSTGSLGTPQSLESWKKYCCSSYWNLAYWHISNSKFTRRYNSDAFYSSR